MNRFNLFHAAGVALIAASAGYYFADHGQSIGKQEVQLPGNNVTVSMDPILQRMLALEKKLNQIASTVEGVQVRLYAQKNDSLPALSESSGVTGFEENNPSSEESVAYLSDDKEGKSDGLVVKEDFQREPLDTEKTSQLKRQLQESIAAFKMDNLVVDSVDCRQSGCLLEVSGDEGIDVTRLLLTPVANTQPESVLISPPIADGENVVTRAFLVF